MDIVVGTTQNSTSPSSESAAKERMTETASADVDGMGEESFPASDPPGVWAWEPPAKAPRPSKDENADLK